MFLKAGSWCRSQEAREGAQGYEKWKNLRYWGAWQRACWEHGVQTARGAIGVTSTDRMDLTSLLQEEGEGGYTAEMAPPASPPPQCTMCSLVERVIPGNPILAKMC